MSSRRITRTLISPLVLGALLGAASEPASAASAIDRMVVAASGAPNNGRISKTSRVPVDLQTGVTIAPGSDVGRTFDKEKSRRYLVVKLCLPKGKTPRGVKVLVHGITDDHRYWPSQTLLIPTPTPTPAHPTQMGLHLQRSLAAGRATSRPGARQARRHPEPRQATACERTDRGLIDPIPDRETPRLQVRRLPIDTTTRGIATAPDRMH